MSGSGDSTPDSVGQDNDAKAPEGQTAQNNEGKGARRRKILTRVIFLIVLVIAAVAAFAYWWAHRNEVSTDDAFTDGRAVSVAPRVSGQVTALDVNDNQFVHKGQTIIQIDPREYQAAVDKARGDLLQDQGELQEAAISLEKARITYPAQLVQAQGDQQVAEANLLNAQQRYHRQHAVSAAATTREQIDQANAGVRQAEGQLKEAQAKVQTASTVAQNIAIAQAKVGQLKGMVAAAQAALDKAKLNLSYTTIHAPQDGWVTRRNVEVGYYLQAGQTIMSLVVPEVWITANFKETQLTRMRQGQEVRISVDAYPQLHLTGHVNSIQMGTGSRFSTFPAENATGNFVKIVQRVPVKIVIDHGLDPNRPLPLGLSVEPVVQVTQYVRDGNKPGVENEVPPQQ